MNRNKQKGKYFENTIAQLIRDELGLDKRYVSRAKSSGISEEEFGDIIISPALFDKLPFIIECKFGYNFTLDYYLTKTPLKSNPLHKFFDQVLREYNTFTRYAERNNIKIQPIPVLIYSGAYNPIMVSFIVKYTPKNVLKEIQKYNRIVSYLRFKIVTIGIADFIAILKKLYGGS
jgi:hypothetical protein